MLDVRGGFGFGGDQYCYAGAMTRRHWYGGRPQESEYWAGNSAIQDSEGTKQGQSRQCKAVDVVLLTIRGEWQRGKSASFSGVIICDGEKDVDWRGQVAWC